MCVEDHHKCAGGVPLFPYNTLPLFEAQGIYWECCEQDGASSDDDANDSGSGYKVNEEGRLIFNPLSIEHQLKSKIYNLKVQTLYICVVTRQEQRSV